MKEFIHVNRLYQLQDISIFNIGYPAEYVAELKSGTPANTIIFILSGKVVCQTYNGDEYTLSPDTLTFFPRNFARTSVYQENTRLISIHIDSNLPELTQEIRQIRIQTLGEYNRSCLEMLKKIVSGEMLGDMILISCIYGLLDCIEKISIQDIPPEMREIHAAKVRMENEFTANLPISDYAKKTYLGDSTFRRLFKQYTGYPPAKYRQLLRLNYVRLLVNSGECNLSEAAQRAGFCSMSYLCRQSRTLYGCTPSEFLDDRDKKAR